MESYTRMLTPPSRTVCLRASPRMAEAGARPAAASRDARISMPVVRRLVELVEGAGVARTDILEAAQIPEEALSETDTAIPMHLVARICELPTDSGAEPALGLRWIERLTVHAFGPVSHTLMHSASLRQTFELLEQYGPLFFDKRIFVLDEVDDEAILRLVDWDVPSPRALRFMTEMSLAGFAAMLGKYGAAIEQACFSHPAPEHRREYERVFGPRVRFDQPFNGLVFDRATLDRRNPHSDHEVRDALTGVLERRLLRATEDAPYALRVRELLSQISPRSVSIGTAARQLGVSERSLRRRLAAEGTSFREIRHEVRAYQARRMLRERRMSIQETAHAMGFSDASAFHRAFKRWTGSTPGALVERSHSAE